MLQLKRAVLKICIIVSVLLYGMTSNAQSDLAATSGYIDSNDVNFEIRLYDRETPHINTGELVLHINVRTDTSSMIYEDLNLYDSVVCRVFTRSILNDLINLEAELVSLKCENSRYFVFIKSSARRCKYDICNKEVLYTWLENLKK